MTVQERENEHLWGERGGEISLLLRTQCSHMQHAWNSIVHASQVWFPSCHLCALKLQLVHKIIQFKRLRIVVLRTKMFFSCAYLRLPFLEAVSLVMCQTDPDVRQRPLINSSCPQRSPHNRWSPRLATIYTTILHYKSVRPPDLRTMHTCKC